jgi:GNAT superfamily N-acetyltransferase
LGYSDPMLGSGSKVCVRKGKVADAPSIAEVFRESWLLAYRGIIPHLALEGYIRRRSPEWWRSAMRSGDGVLVLELDGKVVGYATFGSTRSRGPYQGEIYELYLDPVHQGLGLGERLFESCRHALDMRKLRGLIVWALLDNMPACHFYWRRGGRPIATGMTKIGTAKLEQVAFAWR